MQRFFSTLWAGLFLWLLVTAAALAANQKRQVASIPSGTEIQVRLLNQLDTGETQSGATFSGTVAQPVVVGGRTVLVQGTKVGGRVIEVVSSGRLQRPASITLELTSVRTVPLRVDGKSRLLRSALLIGGAAAAGAAVGGVTGGKKGAAIGAAVGAGAGTATAYFTGKKEIVLPPEVVLTFVGGGAAGETQAVAASRAEPQPSEAAAPYQGEARPGALKQAREAAEAILFSERDQQMIRSYYSGGRGLPPGLAKKGKLPPGLAKQLQRNGTLPPGLQKRYGAQPFPVELTRQLAPVPAGYSRLIIAGRAVLMDRNSRILDIMAILQ